MSSSDDSEAEESDEDNYLKEDVVSAKNMGFANTEQDSQSNISVNKPQRNKFKAEKKKIAKNRKEVKEILE